MNILVINGSPKGEKILPAIMGIFTAWFQKWYKQAAGYANVLKLQSHLNHSVSKYAQMRNMH